MALLALCGIILLGLVMIPFGLPGTLVIFCGAIGYMLLVPGSISWFTVGVIGCMMLAVMTRASLGHTGRKLAASKVTIAAYVALIACVLLRPAAEFFPGAMMRLYACSALLWIVGFGLFCLEYGPILMRERKPLKA